MTLYQIEGDLIALDMAIDEAGGEFSEELEAWFASVNDDLNQKVDGYCRWMAELNAVAEARQAESEVHQAEAERLRDLADAGRNKAKRLKLRLQDFMAARQLKKFSTRLFELARCANGGKTPVKINCLPAALPPEFQRVTTRVEPETDMIRAALESGTPVPGCELGQRGEHLRIK